MDELATCLAPFKVQRAAVAALVETFDHAKTFAALKTHLAALSQVLAFVKQSGDMCAAAAATDLPMYSSAPRDLQRASLSVNRELVLLHWNIGCNILEEQQAQGWDVKTVDKIASDLPAMFPDTKGFSRRNLL